MFGKNFAAVKIFSVGKRRGEAQPQQPKREADKIHDLSISTEQHTIRSASWQEPLRRKWRLLRESDEGDCEKEKNGEREKDRTRKGLYIALSPSVMFLLVLVCLFVVCTCSSGRRRVQYSAAQTTTGAAIECRCTSVH